MKGFKFISEEPEHYHLESGAGVRFKVEKATLNKKAHDEIRKMCAGGMAKGGAVDVTNIPNPAATVNMADGGEIDEAEGQEVQGEPNPEGEVANTPPDQAAPVASTNPGNAVQNLQQYGAGTNNAINQKEAAIQTYMQDTGKANKAAQDIYGNITDQLLPRESFSGVSRSPQEIEAEMAKKNDEWMNKIQKQGDSFDPNRYWANKSTGQKIMAGLALAISGAGGGKSGKNLAADYIHDAINNDIDKQKADMSNTMNLYKMNHQGFQDELQASLASRNQLISVAQMQLAQQAGNIANAKEKLNVGMTMADLEQQKAQNNRAMGLLSQRQPGADGKLTTDPNILAQQFIQDPEQRKAALQEIQHNQDVEKSRAFVMQNFNDLADKHLGGKLSPADRKAAVSATTLELSSRLHMRPTAIEPLVDEVFPGAGLTGLESEETLANKRTRINQFMDNQKNDLPHLKAVTGLGPESFPSTSSSPLAKLNNTEMRMYNIAKAHPNHPDSQRFFRKYGLD